MLSAPLAGPTSGTWMVSAWTEQWIPVFRPVSRLWALEAIQSQKITSLAFFTKKPHEFEPLQTFRIIFSVTSLTEDWEIIPDFSRKTIYETFRKTSQKKVSWSISGWITCLVPSFRLVNSCCTRWTASGALTVAELDFLRIESDTSKSFPLISWLC